MKNRKAIFTVLCIAALVLGACFSSWQPEEAILTLYMGGGTNSRAVYPPNEEIRNNLEHKIQFSGPEEITLEPAKGVETVQIAVTPGRWDITIHSFLDGELFAEGSGSVTAVTGQYNPVEIQMRYVGVNYYTVTFNSGDGSDVDDQVVASGNTATRPDNPTRSGYTFNNWYSDLDLTAVYDFSTPVTANITLYAKWDIVPLDSFIVNFISNEGSYVADQVVTSGNTATRPDNPTRSGFTFDNWYSDLGLTTIYHFSTPVTGNITLYAKWIEDIGDIGISFQWDENAGKITVGSNGVITISKTGASSFTAVYSGAGTVRWYVWGLVGSGSSITIYAADYHAGTYQLVAEATIDGVPYSAEISFVVAD